MGEESNGDPDDTVGSVRLTGEFIAAYGGENSRPSSLDELIRRLDREEFDLVGWAGRCFRIRSGC